MVETTKLLRELVALPSVNPMGRTPHGQEAFEGRVTAYLEEFFRGLAVPYERQTAALGRDNIIAFFHSPGADCTILLDAHQDTVPVDNMTIDPFGARIENGRLYGRGACDIKGGMAAMLAACARLTRERPKAAANVVMACTVDEEFTLLGVKRLVRDKIRADMAVVAEPTQLQIVNAHKGVARWEVITHGRSCHSSSPENGVNAIYHMGAVLVTVERFAEQLRASKVDGLLGPATLSIGRIEGGTSVNTVPDRCRAEVDRRLLPGEDPGAARAELVAYLKRALGSGISFECAETRLHAPALGPQGSEQLVERLGAAIDSVKGAHRVVTVAYGTNASTIALAGIPAVVFGPGDIARAHTCDEWVELDEVEEASAIIYQLICQNEWL